MVHDLFVCVLSLCCPAWLEKDWYYCRRRWSEGTQTKGPGFAPRGMQGKATSVHTGPQWLPVNPGWKRLFIKKRSKNSFIIYRQLCCKNVHEWVFFGFLYYIKRKKEKKISLWHLGCVPVESAFLSHLRSWKDKVKWNETKEKNI